MLRRLVGDDAFFGGVRRFYDDNRFQKAGTDGLRLAFEAETGGRCRDSSIVGFATDPISLR